MTLAIDRQHTADSPEPQSQVEIDELTKALETLDELDPRRAEIVKMRVVWNMMR